VSDPVIARVKLPHTVAVGASKKTVMTMENEMAFPSSTPWWSYTFHHGLFPSNPHSYAIYSDMPIIVRREDASCLRAIVLTEADSTLLVEAVGPESSQLNITLTQLSVSNQEPGTKDTLSKNIEHSVRDDLAINTNLASTIGKSPYTN
jgi:hypothetical protein